MKRSRLLWRIYVYFLLAAVVALAIATGNAVRTLRRLHEAHVSRGLELRGRLAARDVLRFSPAHDADRIDDICKEVGSLTGTRMTVILPEGRVIGDSDEDPDGMDNHAGRPEVAEALRGKTGTSVRYSDTLKKRLKYTALPVERDGEIVAVVRMSQPLSEIRWTQRAVSSQLFTGGLFAVVMFALVALYPRVERPGRWST